MGVAKRFSAVGWALAGHIVVNWGIAIPFTMILGALITLGTKMAMGLVTLG